MRDRLSHVIAHPVTEELAHGSKPKTKGVTVSDRWTWCDALYMAPPTLARLFTATGDRKYLDFLDREFQFTYDHLYDPAEKLFFRDATFFEKKTPNGKKTFWSRGNGWVYGGLALMLDHLPKDHPKRGFYETLFKEMTTAILAAQQPDGLWHPSLLDPKEIDTGETSGSGFFTFGLAWGINHGLLDRAAHLPAITRAWTGLMTRVKPDGLVGYVQPVGAAPDHLEAGDTQDYGTGAFLLAGSEILRLLGAKPADGPALLKAAEKLVAEDVTPRAYARLVPERKDDLAWENDKVAFRVYGPALRSGPGGQRHRRLVQARRPPGARQVVFRRPHPRHHLSQGPRRGTRRLSRRRHPRLRRPRTLDRWQAGHRRHLSSPRKSSGPARKSPSSTRSINIR